MTNIIPIKTQNISSSKWDYFWHISPIKMAVTWCISRLGLMAAKNFVPMGGTLGTLALRPSESTITFCQWEVP